MNLKRFFSIVISMAIVLSLFASSSLQAEAASVYTRPKKVVYLVMDDSGSMGDDAKNDANYALQTFLATLDKDEEVHIYFLNSKRVLSNIDLSQKSNALLSEVRVKYPNSGGGTPFDAVTDAAKDLQKDVKADSKKEYWLVVITDGGFDSQFDPQNYLEKFTNTQLKNKDYPNFLYVGVGGGQRFTVPKGAEDRFFLESDVSIINAMNKAVLDITNRQVVSATNTKNNTLSFDLPYPARNIVVLAQNRDTKITSATSVSELNTNEIYDVEYPVVNPWLQHTTVCFITEKNGSSIKAGRTELTFDKNVSASEVIVMVEPALAINAKYVDEGGNELDPADICIGNKISVEFSVCDSETNAPLDKDTGFGTVSQSITVNGKKYNGNAATFTVTDPDLTIDMVAGFTDGFILDIHDKYTDLKSIRVLSLFLSNSGRFEADIKDLGTAEGIVVTPLVNGSNLSPEDFKDSTLVVKGESFFKNRFTVEKDDRNGTFVIHPKAGFLNIFTPKDEVSFEVVFTSSAGEIVNENITVLITGDRSILPLLIPLLILLLIAYIIWVEVTRKRFPRGSYVKYYTVNDNGAPDGYLSDRIFLNRPSFEKLINGSYLPIPNAKYKVKGEFSCTELTFVAQNKIFIGVTGITETTYTDDFGNITETTSYIPINEDGEPIVVQAPVEDETKVTTLQVPVGQYLRDINMNICIRISTKKHDEQTGHIEM